MGHHRFKATFEVVVAEPNPGNAAADPADQELVNNLTTALKQALVGTVKAKRQNVDYTVEHIKKA